MEVRPSQLEGKGKPPAPPAQGKASKIIGEQHISLDPLKSATTVKGKGKAPPPPTKGKGKSNALPLPTEGVGKHSPCAVVGETTILKPQAAEVLRTMGELQLADGSWALGDNGCLNVLLGVKASEIEAVLKELTLPKLNGTQVWLLVIATSLARQAIERCATIIVAEADASDGLGQRERRAKALRIAEESSVKGADVLKAAEQWLASAWHSASAESGCVLEQQRVRLEQKLSTMLDRSLPRPDWKRSLAARKSMRIVCQACGTEFSGALAECPSCSPPELKQGDKNQMPGAPQPLTLQRLKSGDLLRHWQTFSAAPLDPKALRWQGAKGLMHLGGGSGGVTLLHLEEGVICLKPARANSVAEFFAAHLADFLVIRVAKSRMVSMADDVFMYIRQAIRTSPSDIEEHRDIARRVHGNSEFVWMLEFVPGLSVQGLEVHNRLHSLSPALIREFWVAVGQLIALDALINNVDRIPLLWDNEGNTANLMLLARADDDATLCVVGIDQAVTAIVDRGPGRGQYLDRLGTLARAVFSGSWEHDSSTPATIHAWSVSAALERVQEAFRVNCAVEVDRQALMEGLHSGLLRIAQRWADGSLQEVLSAAVTSATKVFACATVDIGMHQLSTMEDFVGITATAIAKSYDDFAKAHID